MKPKLWDYLVEAFNARPMGMFVAPNWIGVGLAAVAGFINPGFWLLGAGLEAGYLFTLINSPRFRRFVQGKRASIGQSTAAKKQWESLARLNREGRERYRALESRCRSVLKHQSAGGKLGATTNEGLARLLWIYMGLLLTRQTMLQLLEESDREESIDRRVADLEKQLADPELSEILRKSFSGQLDILRQRLAKREEASEKLQFVDAELMRVEEQVELIREQGMVASNGDALSHHIDQVTATLGATTQWITDQQRLLGQFDGLMDDPPLMMMDEAEAMKESSS